MNTLDELLAEHQRLLRKPYPGEGKPFNREMFERYCRRIDIREVEDMIRRLPGQSDFARDRSNAIRDRMRYRRLQDDAALRVARRESFTWPPRPDSP